MDVLQLDISGRPQAWISSREAAVLYASDAVAWTLGSPFHVMRGGWQRSTGLQSRIELHPIVRVNRDAHAARDMQLRALDEVRLVFERKAPKVVERNR